MLGHEQAENSPLPVVERSDPIVQMMETHLYACRMMVTPSVVGEPVLAVTSVGPKPAELELEAWPTLPSLAGKSSPRRTTIPGVVREEDGYERDSDLPGDLPAEVWKEILVQAAGGERILSDAQQKAIVHYARDTTAPMLEKGEMGKPKPFKLWWILERMGCLTYQLKE